jgi:hypothetical protein
MGDPVSKEPLYWVLLLPVLLGFGTCAGSLVSLSGKIKDMPRLKVPGEAVLQLETGEYIGYLESQSVVAGEVTFGNPSVNCAIASLAGSKEVSIKAPSASTSYTFGGYSGQSVMVVSIPKSGDYSVNCSGSGLGALAFGQRIGTMIVVAVAAGLGGFVVTLMLFFRIRKRRRNFVA